MRRADWPELFTVKEVAAYLRISESTAYRMVERGALPGFKVASEWRFDRAQIDRWRRSLEKR